MTSGGVRAGGGPKPNPLSAASQERGATRVLPAAGYRGDVPDFPIPGARPRDLELWAWAWRTPQAAAWAAEPWRHYEVALWCRAATDCERPNPSQAAQSGVRSLSDRIGLSEQGMRFIGWKIANEEPAAAAGRTATTSTRSSSRARMTVLADDADGDARSA